MVLRYYTAIDLCVIFIISYEIGLRCVCVCVCVYVCVCVCVLITRRDARGRTGPMPFSGSVERGMSCEPRWMIFCMLSGIWSFAKTWEREREREIDGQERQGNVPCTASGLRYINSLISFYQRKKPFTHCMARRARRVREHSPSSSRRGWCRTQARP